MLAHGAPKVPDQLWKTFYVSQINIWRTLTWPYEIIFLLDLTWLSVDFFLSNFESSLWINATIENGRVAERHSKTNYALMSECIWNISRRQCLAVMCPLQKGKQWLDLLWSHELFPLLSSYPCRLLSGAQGRNNTSPSHVLVVLWLHCGFNFGLSLIVPYASSMLEKRMSCF